MNREAREKFPPERNAGGHGETRRERSAMPPAGENGTWPDAATA